MEKHFDGQMFDTHIVVHQAVCYESQDGHIFFLSCDLFNDLILHIDTILLPSIFITFSITCFFFN